MMKALIEKIKTVDDIDLEYDYSLGTETLTISVRGQKAWQGPERHAYKTRDLMLFKLISIQEKEILKLQQELDMLKEKAIWKLPEENIQYIDD